MISISQSNEETETTTATNKQEHTNVQMLESDAHVGINDKMRNGTLVLLSTLNRFIYVDVQRI